MKPRQGRAVFSVMLNFTETVTESHTCQKVSGEMSASAAQTTWEAWLQASGCSCLSSVQSVLVKPQSPDRTHGMQS